MSASHFLGHLAIAYNHFHPIDEHRKFAAQLDLFEKNQLRQGILTQLGGIEKRCAAYIESGKAGVEELAPLMEKIKSIKGRLDVLSHEGSPVV